MMKIAETVFENRHVQAEKKSVEERCARLKWALEEAGGNAVVSRTSGVPKTTISTYVNGRDMKASTALALAKACNVSIEWLLTGYGEAQGISPKVENLPREMISVPFLQSEASAGIGLEPIEWGTDKNIEVPVEFLRNLLGAIPKQIFFMKVRGDSMQPTIHTGDTVIIHYGIAPLRDGIYAISVNGMAMVKRLGLKNPSTYSVISDNPFYERFDVSAPAICWGNSIPDAEVRIIGRVIGHFHLEADAFIP